MKHPPRSKEGYDIISLGEAGLDSFALIDEATLLCTLDKGSCLLCLKYADKIPITEFHETLGHNACNNAVGSARLGLKTALYTVIGDDEIGEKVMSKLKKEGVSSRYVQVQKKSKSNYSIVLRYKTERTLFIYHVPRKHRLPRFAKTTWIYLTSLGGNFQSLHEQLLKQIQAHTVKLAFNPGDQQLRAGIKKLEPVLKVCSLLILNKEEAEMLLGHSIEKNSMKDALRALHLFGPEVVVITDGHKGAFGFDGKGCYFSPSLPSHTLERTGAGDSFSTGLLAGIMAKKSLGESLVWGAANAASVVEHIGPQDGLLSRRALLGRIKKAKATHITYA